MPYHLMPYRLTPTLQRDIEEGWDNDREAHALLDVIAAEFTSDPTSVACFDMRIVDRVKLCVLKRKQYIKRHPWQE